MPIVVLDCLKTHYQVRLAVWNGNAVARAYQKFQILSQILSGSVDNRIFREIDSDFLRSGASQDLASITFAASDVQHALPLTKLLRPEIAMDVLQFDFASDLRHVALAGPWQVACRGVSCH